MRRSGRNASDGALRIGAAGRGRIDVGLLRPSRQRYGPDPYYHWKVILFSVGAGLGLFGMISNRDWFVLAAIPILVVGVVLRWFGRKSSDGDGELENPDDPAGSPGGEEGKIHRQP